MSDQLNRIEDMLSQLIKMVGDANARLNVLESEQRNMKQELKNDIATLSERLERKVNTHEYSIDIIQREQFKMRTEIEMLKNK
ncbi:hypothetical protein SD70_27775 [Gordoniibacillus kamchatkensis]|uniref:Uncharacterized protein n=1 Tax=Gordoniibacillus kamchatkensis TaxID=1590651 RepID=A0ABR5ABL2_9BACL|nr:hypothetical protein [Paenibacillus sp. VKM B-2647]KIL38228.1 hypothetical protein SD70_27775 [Paenibacillus sp. VKM B-2647]